MAHTNILEINKIVASMKPKSSFGYDNVSPKILVSTISPIAEVLARIFNSMVDNGIFPDSAKIAKVLPIFKDGDATSFTNYRPISLLPSMSKIFERLIHNRLYKYLTKYNLLHPSQYGFRGKHSTEHAALELLDRISKGLDNNSFVSTIYLDLSKAFDTLDHSILLHKLHYYGVRGKCLDLLRSYLSSRKQYVCFNNINSSMLPVTCGVPQGSILGPLLFILYVNDLCKVTIRSHPILFADDTSLLFIDNDILDLYLHLNTELDRVYSWLKSNKLSLNIKKTKYMLFRSPHKPIPTYHKTLDLSLEGHKIELVNTYKFLGIWFDEHLNWKHNTDDKCKKIAKINGILNRIKFKLSTDVLKTIYFGLIHSHLTYGLLVWHNENSLNNLDRLFLLQKRSVRLISKSPYIAHTDPIFKRLKVQKISDIFLTRGLKLFRNASYSSCPIFITNCLIPQCTSHSYNTRHRTRIPLARARTNIVKQGISYKTYHVLGRIHDQYKLESCCSLKKLKHAIFDSYDAICHIRNCYICNI